MASQDSTLPNAAALVPLDSLELLVIVDNETDTLSSVDEGVPQLTEVARVAAQRTSRKLAEGHTGKVVFDRLCGACHGLSVLVTGRRGDRTHTLLFDVGPDPDLWLANARRLGVDLASIECIFLSHWHFDHSGALPEVVAITSQARRAAGREAPPRVDLHPDRPDQRGTQLPDGSLLLLPEEPTFDAIVHAGGEVVRRADPHTLCGGFFFGSGRIDRVTEYETGLPGHHSLRDGRLEPDPLLLDERFVAAMVRGRGLSVLSACSHAGIVNACLAARNHFPEEPVDVVFGGFHLAGKAMESRTDATLRDLAARIEPRLLAPGHCTGWRAKARLAEAFSPGRYAPSVVGSSYRLHAPRP